MLSYDFVRYFERLSVSTIDDLLLPDAHFFMIDKLIAFDHAEKRSWIIVCPGVRLSGIHDAMVADPDWSSLYDEAEYLVSTLSQTLASAVMHPYAGSRLSSQHNIHSLRPLELCHDITKEYYMDMVIRAKEYIGAGDIFQANLSQRVSAEIRDRSAWDLYRSLRSINPSPFAAYADFGDYQIVCSSPERLLRVNQGTVETRPIAGTRPRGKNMMEDAALRRELLLNEKERAEHLMLIDLERNDLGRVSSYGTVSVDEHMITEDYSHVIHIVSNISGNLAHGKDCFDALRAVFPGGTITGVPKV
jgi:anthranilate/para-aminobenzoate synthase component I